MNGIENLIKQIMSEADDACKALEASAAEECERIRQEYAKKEQEKYWETVNIGAKDAERRLERLSGLAALEAKKHVLTTRHEMLAMAFKLAAEKIVSLPEGEYVSFLARLASSASLTGTETIFLSPRDLKRVGKRVLSEANAALSAEGKTAALTLSDEPRDIRGGLILAGERYEADCCLDTLIEQERDELTPIVSDFLFN